jgi:hypothetical protein
MTACGRQHGRVAKCLLLEGGLKQTLVAFHLPDFVIPKDPPHLHPAADYATADAARSGGGVDELASAHSFEAMLAQREVNPVSAGQQEK